MRLTVEQLSKYGILSASRHADTTSIEYIIVHSSIAPDVNRAGMPLYDAQSVREAFRKLKLPPSTPITVPALRIAYSKMPQTILERYGVEYVRGRRQLILRRGSPSGQVCADKDDTCSGCMTWINQTGNFMDVMDYIALCNTHDGRPRLSDEEKRLRQRAAVRTSMDKHRRRLRGEVVPRDPRGRRSRIIRGIYA